MKSTQNPSLRGSTTQLLASLDAQFNSMVSSSKKNAFGSVPIEWDQRLKNAKANTVGSIHKLAVLYHGQKKFEQAERLYQESLTLYSIQYGMHDPRIGQCLNNVGRLYLEEGWYSEAEILLDRSLQIVRDHYGADHAKVARRLANLAELCDATDRGEEAVKYYSEALEIERKELGDDAAQTSRTMRALASTLRKLERIAEAEELEKKCHQPRNGDRRRAVSRRAETTSDVGEKLSSNISAGERRRRPERRNTARRN
jgi:tetratricopeptide (TPR) repeat protein